LYKRYPEGISVRYSNKEIMVIIIGNGCSNDPAVFIEVMISE
jgi:hypothetical protein